MYQNPERDWMTGHRVLRELRALQPERPLSLRSALLIAERQAQALCAMAGVTGVPVSTEIISGLPAIRIAFESSMPRGASGACVWDQRDKLWVICVRACVPRRRQRFSICHEFHHVLSHGQAGLRDPEQPVGSLPAREYVAEYFAGCLLVPSLQLKRAFYAGTQDLSDLAERFDVSTQAVAVRLDQLDLRPRFAEQQRSAA